MYGLLTSPLPSGPYPPRPPEPTCRRAPQNPSHPRAAPPPRPPPVPAARRRGGFGVGVGHGAGRAARVAALDAGCRPAERQPRAPAHPVAAAMSAAVRWLGVYREVLLVGVLLSWFPNVPWERQPFSALRGLCDPFLALCREVMPRPQPARCVYGHRHHHHDPATAATHVMTPCSYGPSGSPG
ncbi:hypothetical protein BS78_06G071700 [Paspalum vaginatum]|nr:hypothetical protein BS78_06G071700 [Paspalum vaginatum]